MRVKKLCIENKIGDRMENRIVTEMTKTKETEMLQFDDIYDEYYNKIYKYTNYRVNNHSDVEDLVSQIFLKIHEKLHTFKPDIGNLSTWIFTIASNTIKDYYKRNQIRQFLSLDSLKSEPKYDYSMEDSLEKEEEYLLLRKTIKSLPKRGQQLIALKYGAELTYDEIAKIMKITPNYVGVLLHRYLNDIRESMEGYYE